MKYFLTAITLCLLSVSSSATERLELKNGLRVFLVPQRSAPVVSVTVFMPVGRAHEPARHAGISHFVEHMMYRATGRRPGGRSESEAWAAGARFSAQTWEDFTRYEVALPAERLPLALDVLSDALTGAKFLPAEVEEERRVIIEEVAQRRADAELWTWEEAGGLSFRPDPYGERIIGTQASIRAITRDELYGWYRSRYRPDGSVLVVTGHFDRATILDAVRGAFGSWRGEGPTPPPPPPLAEEYGHYQEMVVTRAGASPMLAVTAAMPPYLHPDYLATRFLRELMAGWLERRLVSRTKVAIATSVWYVPRLRRNLLRIRLRLARASDAPRARDELLKLLAEMGRPGFPWGGLNEVGANFRAREVLMRENLSTLATVIGRGALAGYYHPDGPPEHLAAENRYDRTSTADVIRVARTYFHPANLRVTLLTSGPATLTARNPAPGTGEMPRFTPAEIPKRLPWDRVKTLTSPDGGTSPRDDDATLTNLPGGARLVYLERTALPVVGIAIVIPAGSRTDPRGLEGLAALTLRAVERETKGDTRFRLRWDLFAAGDHRDFRVTRDATHLAFVVPKEDFTRILPALIRIFRDPVFSPGAVEASRGSLLGRARRAREQVGNFAEQAFRDAVLGDVPGRHAVSGTPESIARITVKDIQRFHADHYRLADATIAIVGDVSPRVVRTTVLNALGDMEDAPVRRPTGSEWPAREPSPGRLELRHASGRGYVIAGAIAPAFAQPERAATEILRLAIGWQVFEEMTESRSIAYQAGPLYLDSFGAGPLGFYVGVEPASLDTADDALAEILAAAAKGSIVPELFTASRGAWLGSHARSYLRSDTVAIRLATHLTLGRPVDADERLADQVRKLHPADVARLATRLLATKRRVTVIVSPEDTLSK